MKSKKKTKNYPTSEESNKFAKQFDLTLKEIYIDGKVIEAVKTIKKEAKTHGQNQLKKPGNKTPYTD